MAGKGLWHLWQGTETIVGGRSMTMWKKELGRWSGPGPLGPVWKTLMVLFGLDGPHFFRFLGILPSW